MLSFEIYISVHVLLILFFCVLLLSVLPLKNFKKKKKDGLFFLIHLRSEEKEIFQYLCPIHICICYTCDFSTNDFVCSTLYIRARAVLYNLRMNIIAHCLAKHVVVAI